ncbi:MAG: family 2 glycosyl [Desulfovibrionaceae bacterium]|nr:MAG: family 2 glycosyl [Desulfovibrionaceae bacterium]
MRRASPLVTVLMTVRNGEPYVRQAAKSALEQTMGDLELLVVDDASTDSSLDSIRALGDDRVRIILNGRPGRTSALNEGLRHARGEFVAILDADDIATPNRLQLQLDSLEHHPDVVMIGGGYRAIDPQGEVLAEHLMPAGHQDILNCLPVWNPIPHSTMTYRRRQIMALGGYPARYFWAQDFALILKAASRHTLANIPEVLSSIRQHPRQMTARPENTSHRLLDSYQLLRKARFIPGVAEASQAEGRRVCAGLAREYLTHLASMGKGGRALAFRLTCVLEDPWDRELRKALGPIPRCIVSQQPGQPQRGVDG